MCGITGIYNFDGCPIDPAQLREMNSLIRHRGPDDEGFLLLNTGTGEQLSCYGDDTCEELKAFLNPLDNSRIEANLALANRRLAILDLSVKGHQPMSDTAKRVWLTYNGEIYNYRELRAELQNKGYRFNNETDTEVIINSYLEWGFDCLARFRGMWAFALWDKEKKILFCARDRFGIKPFYYTVRNNSFIFGSELKQLLCKGSSVEINEMMLMRIVQMGSFLYYGDETLFSQIKVLPHSHYLVCDGKQTETFQYYDLPVEQFESSTLTYEESCEEYRNKLSESVKLHLRSDTEVGSCLSGGLDSSAIVSLAGANLQQPIKTFTAYYEDKPAYDERKWVNELQKSQQITPYYISPRPEDFIRDFYRATYLQDYPVIGSSPLSQYFVMKLAAEKGIKVVLDGQGSDEINVGYAHSFYRYYADMLRDKKFSPFLREFREYLSTKGSKSFTEKIFKTLLVLLFGESYRYRKEIKHNLPNLLTYKFNDKELIGRLTDLTPGRLSTFLYHLVMTIYLQSLLHFEDRNSMAFSVESRVPFLDHELVEMLFTLPSEYKIKGGISKRLHRDAMRGVVPDSILQRKDKVNFSTPAEAIWMKNEMNNFVQGIVQSNSFKQRGLFSQKVVKQVYRDYLAGKDANGSILWKIVSIEIWLRVFVDRESS